MSLKTLAEGIILQTIEDLWSENCREDCITFFMGKDFRLCAELAGMELDDQVELLNMVRSSMNSLKSGSGMKRVREKDSSRQERSWKKQLAAGLNYT